jgi:hypothetical protein
MSYKRAKSGRNMNKKGVTTIYKQKVLALDGNLFAMINLIDILHLQSCIMRIFIR